MGGGASNSSKSNGSEKRSFSTPKSLAIQRKQMMEMVENFVSNVYTLCPRNDAMWLILSSKLGQKAFEGFLRSDYTDDFLELFLLLSQILASKSIGVSDLKGRMEEVKQRLEKPLISNAIPELFRNEFFYGDEIPAPPSVDEYDETAETEKSRLMKLMERLQNDVVVIMAKDYYNDFLLSKNYKNWRAAESSHATATTAEDAAASSNNIPILSAMSGEISFRGSVSLAVNKSPSTRTRYKMKKIVNPADLSTSAFSGLFSSAKEEVLGSRDSWLQQLLAAVEGLPLAFSLAKVARDQSQGFPLIYVNKYFEKMTGFPRREILGMAAKEFLQCEQTEKTKTEALAKGLAGMVSAVSVVSNKAKDGRIFKNLVALKPVMDSHRRFAYVIALHYDVTSESPASVNNKASLSEELLEMLPTSIITEDDDHLEIPTDSGESRREGAAMGVSGRQ